MWGCAVDVRVFILHRLSLAQCHKGLVGEAASLSRLSQWVILRALPSNPGQDKDLQQAHSEDWRKGRKEFHDALV